MHPLRVQAKLAEKYRYKPLPDDLSQKYRRWFEEQLPKQFQGKTGGQKNCFLYSQRGILIARGFTRIVIGDYGAFIEIPDEQIVKENIQVRPGQEKRIFEPRFKWAKYHWYVPKGDLECKLYHQQRTVTYADYVPKMWYVSPYHVRIEQL